MNTRSNYQDDESTKLMDKTGAFFAFSEKQFNEQKNNDLEKSDYVTLQSGMIVPKCNAADVVEGLKTIYEAAIAADIAENGKETIIKRELYNFESFYSNSIEKAVEALRSYGYTEGDVQAVYNKELQTIDWDSYL